MGSVELIDVSHRYSAGGEMVNVLNDVNITIRDGGFCAISGPSGSGKSTLLNMIGTIDKPQKGRIIVAGQDVQDMSERALVKFRARHIGFIFQSFHLIPVLTAVENVAWPLYFQGIPKKQRLKAAREMLARVGLADQAHRLPRRLSGGQQQRVAIARALVSEPSIVLADEPTANLDHATAQDIMALAASLNENSKTTFIAATHDPLVVEYANQHLHISQGQMGTAPMGADGHV